MGIRLWETQMLPKHLRWRRSTKCERLLQYTMVNELCQGLLAAMIFVRFEQKFGRAGEVYKSAKDGRKLGGLRCRNVEDKRFEININTIRQSKKYFVA